MGAGIDEDLVRRLLASQHPDLADRPVGAAAQGWDNAIFRLGDDLAVRMPRREIAVPLLEHERRWLPHLAPRLPLPIPTPVRSGVPEHGYPWPWAITPWFPGRPALHEPPADPDAAAEAMGGFLRAMHVPAPADAPTNPYRGIPLIDRDDDVVGWVRSLRHQLDADRVLTCWRYLADLPRWDGPPLWLHGDIHPLNVLVHRGAIAAVIDFGDVTAGDPATDLAIAWMMFGPKARATLRRAAGDIDDLTWERGRGWALCMGLAYLAGSSPTNQLRPLGRATVSRVLDGGTVGPWPPRR